jgi:phenylpropionate dioxygenase-like ring-hydroxylating dioxygenase large terminal subunit
MINGSILENAWYCAAWSHELRKNGVLERKLLNRHVALYRDSGGRAHALAALCPHRGANLARGRVVDGTLECPLHGWRFDAGGRCVAIPSQPPALRISPGARVPSYLVCERQGILWIWPGRDSAPDPPQRDVWDERPDRRRYFHAPELWQCTFVNAVENAIDTTHVPFVHARTLEPDQRRLYPKQSIVFDDDFRGFSGEDRPDSDWGRIRTVGVGGGRLGRLASRFVGMSTIARERYRFDLGGSLSYEIRWNDGTWDALVAHATPGDEHHTWVFGVSIRTRATHFLGDVAQKWFVRSLMKEDRVAMTAMLSNELAVPAPVSVVGDEPMLAFHRVYQHHLNRQQH